MYNFMLYLPHMKIQEQIQSYITSQPERKSADMEALHQLIVKVSPASKLSFFDGKDSNGKVVANPNIGYGSQTMTYADGATRETFQIGISANTTGISIYIIGIKDKTYLAKTFGKKLGKATITGYCIKFKTLKDLNMETLQDVLRYGFQVQHEKKPSKAR